MARRCFPLSERCKSVGWLAGGEPHIHSHLGSPSQTLSTQVSHSFPRVSLPSPSCCSLALWNLRGSWTDYTLFLPNIPSNGPASSFPAASRRGLVLQPVPSCLSPEAVLHHHLRHCIRKLSESKRSHFTLPSPNQTIHG